jgi:hypothetical protein
MTSKNVIVAIKVRPLMKSEVDAKLPKKHKQVCLSLTLSCDYCGARVRNLPALKKHKKQPTQESINQLGRHLQRKRKRNQRLWFLQEQKEVSIFHTKAVLVHDFPYCGDVLSKKDTLKKHTDACPTYKLVCEYCNVKMRDKAALNRHKSSKHKINQKKVSLD